MNTPPCHHQFVDLLQITDYIFVQELQFLLGFPAELPDDHKRNVDSAAKETLDKARNVLLRLNCPEKQHVTFIFQVEGTLDLLLNEVDRLISILCGNINCLIGIRYPLLGYSRILTISRFDVSETVTIWSALDARAFMSLK